MTILRAIKTPIARFLSLWSATEFGSKDVNHYAQEFLCRETRRGVITLATLSLTLLCSALALQELLNFSETYTYTFSLLALMSLHIIWSVRNVHEVHVMHLLGMVLLIITGAGFMLLAHRHGSIDAGLIAGVVLLIISIPLVPWGLRESTILISLITVMFLLSANSVQGRFETQNLWVLQFMIIASALITSVLIARNVYVRKHDVRARFELERTRRELELQSHKDPLTGAWNRRFLDKNFLAIAQQCRDNSRPLCSALLDIDDFKMINDTFGHHFADKILEKLARTFAQLMGKNGYLIRLGGDEFQLLYMGEGLGDVIDRGVRILQNDLELLAVTNGKPVCLSVGYASVDRPERQAMETLYKKADSQLYKAKRINKGNDESDEFGTETITQRSSLPKSGGTS